MTVLTSEENLKIGQIASQLSYQCFMARGYQDSQTLGSASFLSDKRRLGFLFPSCLPGFGSVLLFLVFLLQEQDSGEGDERHDSADDGQSADCFTRFHNTAG